MTGVYLFQILTRGDELYQRMRGPVAGSWTQKEVCEFFAENWGNIAKCMRGQFRGGVDTITYTQADVEALCWIAVEATLKGVRMGRGQLEEVGDGRNRGSRTTD